MKIKLYHDVAGIGKKGDEKSVSQEDGCRLVCTGSAAVLEQVEKHEVEAHAAHAPRFAQGSKGGKARSS